MKHQFVFSGQMICLDQPEPDVIGDMQKAINKYYPSPNNFVRILSYSETGLNSFEIEVARQFSSGGGLALGDQFICDQDESMLTGLSIDVFQPFKPGVAMLAPLIPWYDDMVYAPVDSFCCLWKQMNQKLANEKIRKITILPSSNGIYITVKY